ncbi:BCCT family transporter [Macrococcus hajekii]|uniref:BCCT family transporter n=1 Tax=Macrococcus hajekii TaxID=198482 RepID=A0A4V3BDW9_9STAP|nr:BCCT family transporter [Macrococcus hajekii]TDM01684.1 BCCT family transporter [Macrococcus hajekii]GGB06580.1 glycine/betaine ABC transporter permease [Macrococcus hajekii]
MKRYTPVFIISAAICMLFALWGAILPDNMKSITVDMTSFITENFGWYYLLTLAIILIFCLYILFSPFGGIKLGAADEEAEFSLPSWFAMLFSAGMGMGLVFWTTAEPISHAFKATPGAKPGSNEAVDDAFQYAFFHWGIHAWAVYGVVALVLAYFSFYKGYPGLISATLVPLFGEKRMTGPIGKTIDVLAIIATVMGVAATLGFGTAQINEGLNYLFHIPSNFMIQVLILIVSTILFTWSAWTGIDKGIKSLSNINMVLGFVLMIILFFVGPTLYILNTFTDTLGNYIAHFIDMTLRLEPLENGKRTWINNWTVFYWAWWIAWAPFVGIFIARVSRGRTIKEFILGVLFVPALVCFIFFAVFGASAVHLQLNGIDLSQFPVETTTFAMLQHYPLGKIMSFITLFVIALFFITSADSATYVLGMLSSNGDIHPTSLVKVTWGLLLSLIAGIVMYAGGTQGLQNVLIIAALPFSVVIFMMMFSLLKALQKNHR